METVSDAVSTGSGRRASQAVAIEEAILAVASRQHGVVSRAQLLEAGLSPDAVDRRVRARRLRWLHRGVYLVGPMVAPHVREMAATLACGGSGVVSHRTAAGLWQLVSHRQDGGAVEVIRRHTNRGKPGLIVHRIRTLRQDEVTRLHGIPITTPARTLLDLASSAEVRVLERAVAEALARRLTTASQILALVARHRRRPGTRRLAALIEAGTPPLTRSVAEERFLTLVTDGGLPAPEVDVAVLDFRVDFIWRAERLIVEIDGFAFHSSRAMFERDRRRDAVLAAAGMRVIRVTWRQLEREPKAVLVRLAQALVAAPPPPRRDPIRPRLPGRG